MLFQKDRNLCRRKYVFRQLISRLSSHFTYLSFGHCCSSPQEILRQEGKMPRAVSVWPLRERLSFQWTNCSTICSRVPPPPKKNLSLLATLNTPRRNQTTWMASRSGSQVGVTDCQANQRRWPVRKAWLANLPEALVCCRLWLPLGCRSPCT